MRDHKDVTDYASLGPAIRIPAGMCRALTPAECIARAEEMEERAHCWLDPAARDWDLEEARGWRRLAQERAS